MKKKLRVKLRRKQKAVYDDLFYRQTDPAAANLTLLVFELERYYAKKGIIPCFGNFKADKTQLDDFLKINEIKLMDLFGKRFPDPESYCFGDFKEKEINKFYQFNLEGI